MAPKGRLQRFAGGLSVCWSKADPLAHVKERRRWQGLADPRCQPIGVHGGKVAAEQTVLNNLVLKEVPPCGSSIPESAGGVRRRVGEGLLTGHHFRKQPPGDWSERETVM